MGLQRNKTGLLFGELVFFSLQFWWAGGFYRLSILTLTQHLQAPAGVNEEGTLKDFAEVKGWEEWAVSSGMENTEMGRLSNSFTYWNLEVIYKVWQMLQIRVRIVALRTTLEGFGNHGNLQI